MFNFGTSELILVLVIALVVFGPGKLPEVGKAIGKSLNEFKGAMSGEKKADVEVKEIKEVQAEAKKKEDIKITPLSQSSTKHVEDHFDSKKSE